MKSRQLQLVVALAAAVCALAGTPSAAVAAAATHSYTNKRHELRDASLDSQKPSPPQQQLKRTFRVRTRKSVLDQALVHTAQDPNAALDIWSVRAVADADRDDPMVDATIYATPASMQAFERAPLSTARTSDSEAAPRMRIFKHTRGKNSMTIDDKNVSATEWMLELDQEDRAEQELIETDRREVTACLNRTDGFLAELQRTPPKRYTTSAFFDCFRPYEHVFAFFDALAEQNHGILTKLPAVSRTLEGRSIPAYRLSALATGEHSGKTTMKKKALYTQALIHAREWQGGAATFYSLAHLVDELRRGSTVVTALLREFDWYFVPVVNIDGYAYSGTADRYWRTNRRVVDSSGASIAGVDLNRNFGPAKYFNRKPEQNDAETNPGAYPLSEPSTAGLFEFITSLENLRGIVDVHGFGGQVLRPFSNGAGEAPKPFGPQLKMLGDGVAVSISKHTKAEYASETGAFLYEAYGCFDDGMFLEFNYTVPAITIEVEGDDFIAPQSSIRRVGASIYHGLMRFAHEVLVYSDLVLGDDSDSDSSSE